MELYYKTYNVLLHVCYSVLACAVAVTSIFMTGVKHSDSN